MRACMISMLMCVRRLVKHALFQDKERAGLVSAVEAVEQALTGIACQQNDAFSTISSDETWMMQLNQELANARNSSKQVEHILDSIPKYMRDNSTGNLVYVREADLRNILHELREAQADLLSLSKVFCFLLMSIVHPPSSTLSHALATPRQVCMYSKCYLVVMSP